MARRDRDVAGGKQGIAGIRNDKGVIVEVRFQALEEALHGHFRARDGLEHTQRGDMRDGLARAGLDIGLQDALQETVQVDGVVGVKADGGFLTGGIDGVALVQVSGKDTQVKIGQEHTQEDETIAALHVLADGSWLSPPSYMPI